MVLLIKGLNPNKQEHLGIVVIYHQTWEEGLTSIEAVS